MDSRHYLKKCFGEIHEGIEIVDKLREAVLMEESEWYDTFDAEERKIFLWRVLWHLACGGSCCQYEDYAT
jgi:hypothetical protein